MPCDGLLLQDVISLNGIVGVCQAVNCWYWNRRCINILLSLTDPSVSPRWRVCAGFGSVFLAKGKVLTNSRGLVPICLFSCFFQCLEEICENFFAEFVSQLVPFVFGDFLECSQSKFCLNWMRTCQSGFCIDSQCLPQINGFVS